MLIDVLRYYLQGNTSHLIIEHFLPTLTEQWEVPSVPASSCKQLLWRCSPVAAGERKCLSKYFTTNPDNEWVDKILRMWKHPHFPILYAAAYFNLLSFSTLRKSIALLSQVAREKTKLHPAELQTQKSQLWLLVWIFWGLWEDISSKIVFLKNFHHEVLTITP